MSRPRDECGLERVLDMAQAALDDPSATAADLARRAHLSRFHFDRLVTAASGESPGALRRRLLLERAAYHARRHPERTLLQIAIEAGFSSHEAFSRAFVKAYGRPPSATRADVAATLRDLAIPTPNGVHFQPPGGLRLPAAHQETSMDILQELVDHHVESLTALIEAAAAVADDVLDRAITSSVESIDGGQTLRSLLNAMVTQEEHWLAALRGGDWPDEGNQTVAGLLSRHRTAGHDYCLFVAETIASGTFNDTFLDTTCSPPQAHTVGGIVGHVITFGAVRRTMAVGALWTAGHQDIGLADPRPRLDSLAGPDDCLS